MTLYCDLHIHSALSPCGDDDMTPNNIVNMAALIGLNAIAVTDHNCGANLPAVCAVAKTAGITLVPGIELNTAEEVHLLAYFEECKAAFEFGEELYDALPDVKNNEEFFGRQLIMNENDEIIGKKEKLLISALPYSIEECTAMIRKKGGIAVPAHINRDANSIINNLGFIPPELKFKTLETAKELPVLGADESEYNIIHSSDAHYLGKISERENYLETEENSVKAILEKLE